MQRIRILACGLLMIAAAGCAKAPPASEHVQAAERPELVTFGIPFTVFVEVKGNGICPASLSCFGSDSVALLNLKENQTAIAYHLDIVLMDGSEFGGTGQVFGPSRIRVDLSCEHLRCGGDPFLTKEGKAPMHLAGNLTFPAGAKPVIRIAALEQLPDPMAWNSHYRVRGTVMVDATPGPLLMQESPISFQGTSGFCAGEPGCLMGSLMTLYTRAEGPVVRLAVNATWTARSPLSHEMVLVVQCVEHWIENPGCSWDGVTKTGPSPIRLEFETRGIPAGVELCLSLQANARFSGEAHCHQGGPMGGWPGSPILPGPQPFKLDGALTFIPEQ